jgi:hypothetical protein
MALHHLTYIVVNLSNERCLKKSNQIKSNQIKSNQIKSNQIKSNQIKSVFGYGNPEYDGGS